jgi:hypothetical protein
VKQGPLPCSGGRFLASEPGGCPVPPGGPRARLTDVERFIGEVAVHSHHLVPPGSTPTVSSAAWCPDADSPVRPGPAAGARVRAVAAPPSQCTSAAPDAVPPDVFDRVRPAVGMWIPTADQTHRPAGLAPGPLSTSTGSAGSTHRAATYGSEHRPSGNSHGTHRKRAVEVVAVDGSRLSPREQHILDQIENTLSQDQHLERELRTLHLSVAARCGEEMRQMRTVVLAVLALASGLLLVIAARTPTPGPLAAFAATSTAALTLGATGLHAWARRRRRP